MQRRIIAAVAAVLLAGIGAILLYSYVNTAETRAMSTMSPTQVLVVAKVVPAGTLGANLGPFVELKALPRVAVAPEALTSTSSVAELATTTDLQVGEQVIASRFAPPNTTSTGEIAVPSGLQQVTVQLSPTRLIGTSIEPGAKVAVFISAEENQVRLTQLAFREVLVTRIQGVPTEPSEEGDGAAPSTDVLVTMAVEPVATGQIVWGAEFGRLWLALEPEDGDLESLSLTKVKTIFK